MKLALAVLLLLLAVFFGCIQKPEQPPATGAATFDEANDLETDLNDFSDLQNSLSDAALDDSGIDANSFS